MVCLLAWLGLFIGSAAVAAPAFEDTIAQRTQACTTCHGDQGRAGPDAYYPRLAGKPAGYLYNQLINLRDGRRHYPLMTGMLAPLSNAYLMEMAQYFSALQIPYSPPLPATASADALQRGRSLVNEGDKGRNIPACASCHGNALMGVSPNIPALLGLSRDYLNAQLGGWQTGQRKAHAPDCMAQIAKSMTAQDVSDITAWLAAQAVPANSKPAAQPPAGSMDVKSLQCGNASAATADTTDHPLMAPPDGVARGAYLARAGNCMTCHTVRDGQSYAGGRKIDTPFGTLYTSNLTPDKTHGIGNWSPDDFWRALHQGKSKDGRLLYPAFPYTHYTYLTRTDSDDLYAFMQSLPTATTPNTPHALRWPYRTQTALWLWRAMYFKPGDGKSILTTTNLSNPSAQWARGAYLVQALGHCSACHATRNDLGASVDSSSLGGGQIPQQNWYAPALNARSEGSMSDWPLADIMALFKTGVSSRGSASGPMAQVVQHSTQFLSDADLTAMAVYLKALPEPKESGSAAATQAAGLSIPLVAQSAKLYQKQCAQCHGERGQGVPGAYPALAGNRAVTLANPVNLIQAVMYGGFAPTTQGNPRPYGMPPYALALNDRDMAAVLTHIRTAWGNRALPVSELEVSRIRALQKP